MKETGFPNNTINIYWGKRVSFNSNRQKLLLETSKKITLLLRFEGCGGWGRRRVVNDREMNFIRHIHECVSNELQLAWVGVVFWYLQKYPILAVFGPSCRPGWIFLVQNAWKRCPPYRYMFHVGLAPLGGLLGPNIQFFQKYPFFAVFWLKNGGL